MLHRTNGIILHTVNYSESSLIVKIYTSEFGLQSYLISGVKGKKSKNKSALLQPLSLVDLIVSNTPKTGLNRINEIGLLQPYSAIPYDIIKSTVAIFLNEILYKTLKEEHGDIQMFEFIKNALLVLDLKQESCSCFHIYFLIQLSTYLGFSPQGTYSDQSPFFDLKEGQFTSSIPSHFLFLNKNNSRILYQFMKATFENFHSVSPIRAERKELLDGLIQFYQLHIAGFGEIKSLSVLEEITN